MRRHPDAGRAIRTRHREGRSEDRAGTAEHGRRRHRGQRRSPRAGAPERGRGRRRRDPGARARGVAAIRPRTCCCARASRRRRARRSTSWPLGVRRGVAVIGFPEWDGECHNSAAVVADGRVQAVYRKRFLPNYGVFDEARYFRAGDDAARDRGDGRAHRHRRVRGHLVPDARWPPTSPRRASTWSAASRPRRTTGARATGASGCSATRADDCAAALAFCNLVGGQDELVFDGRSAVFDASGELVARAPQFTEDLLVTDVDLSLSAPPAPARAARPPPARAPARRRQADRRRPGRAQRRPAPPHAPSRRPSGARPRSGRALRLGLRDYVGQERLPRRHRRALRRHRLRAHRRARGRRPGAPSG